MKHKLVVISLDALQTGDLDLLETLPYGSRWLKDAAIAVSGGMSAEDAMAECVATSNAALQE